MGAWASYRYVIAIFKNESKMSSFYRRHLCTLVYLPSLTSCSTGDLVKTHGNNLHELSGDRIGFLFLREQNYEFNDGDAYRLPKKDRVAARWTGYFSSRKSVNTVVTDDSYPTSEVTQIAPPIQSARTLSQQLGVASQTPCILIACHYSSEPIYIHKLGRGDAKEIVTYFDYFSSHFYDWNTQLLSALDQCEKEIDARCLTGHDLIQLKDESRRRVRDISAARSLVGAMTPDALTRATVLLPPSAVHEHRPETAKLSNLHSLFDGPSGLVSTRKIAEVLDLAPGPSVESPLGPRIIRDIILDLFVMRDFLSRKGPRGMSFNRVVSRVALADQEALGLIPAASLTTDCDFGAWLEGLEGTSQSGRNRIDALRRHLQKIGWLDRLSIVITLIPDHLGPFLSISNLLGAVTSPLHPNDPHDNGELRNRIGSILDELIRNVGTIIDAYEERYYSILLTYLDAWELYYRRLNDALNHFSEDELHIDLVLSKQNAPEARKLLELMEERSSILRRVTFPVSEEEQLSEANRSKYSEAAKAMIQSKGTMTARPAIPSTLTLSDESRREHETSEKKCDVFLAHNSRDKQQVIAIAQALRKRGIKPWLDVEQIPPGVWFQDAIQMAIADVKAAIIVIGPNGLGKWQTLELRSLISQCVDRGVRVIPALLPDVRELPPDLLFLKELNYVRFGARISDPAALAELVWGITGKRPS